MGYSLVVKPKHLILKRNGKKADLYYKKFGDDEIYSWTKRRVPGIKKDWIDQMLSVVGVKQEMRKSNDTRRVPRKTRKAKKERTI